MSPSQHAAPSRTGARAAGAHRRDNAARDAGFIPDRERAHVQGGGYDEDSQNAARAAAGGFFDDSSRFARPGGDYSYDPTASGASSATSFDVPHDPKFRLEFRRPAGDGQDGPVAYGASEGAATGGFFGDDRGDAATGGDDADDS